MTEKSKNLLCYGVNLDVKNPHIKGEEECGPVETGMKGTAVREEIAHMPHVPFRMEYPRPTKKRAGERLGTSSSDFNDAIAEYCADTSPACAQPGTPHPQ